MVVDSQGVCEVHSVELVPVVVAPTPVVRPTVTTSFSWVTVKRGRTTWERLVIERVSRL